MRQFLFSRSSRLLLLAAGALSLCFLTGCSSSLDDLTDRAINAIGTRVSDAMEDVDVKEVMGNLSDKIGDALTSMPETSSALKDTVSSLTSSFLSDVSSDPSASASEESASPSEDRSDADPSPTAEPAGEAQITEDGSYTGKDEVAAYLHTYGRLPGNYITSEAAKNLGWDGEGDLWAIQSGAALGGDDYANLSGLLPSDGERSWKQCDVNYNGGIRGPERLCYSNDGLIYYSPDRFTTFVEIVF